MGEKLTRHHLLAKFRGGRYRGNIVKLPRSVHTEWHSLFGLLTPEEACEFIRIVMVNGRKWTYRDLQDLRMEIMAKTSCEG